MKCPCCNNEMEKGQLRSRGGVYFLPDGEKKPLLFRGACATMGSRTGGAPTGKVITV